MRRSAAIVVAASLLLAPVSARAYCRTTTSRAPADYDPSVSGCYDAGLPLYWANACVSYDLQKNASEQISYGLAAEGIAIAFSKWTGTICADGPNGGGRASIDVRDYGPVTCGEVQYNQYGPNQHVIIFRDTGWPYHDSSNELALTTVTFDTDTGEIYDADMEINSTLPGRSSAPVPLSTSEEVPPGGYDFESIVTHETGHFLGMAHSQDTYATMYAHYAPGTSAMRNLTEDDVDGICSIYLPSGLRSVAKQASPQGALPEEACDPTPRHGFTTVCGTGASPPPSSSQACATSAPRQAAGSDSTGALALLGAVTAVVARRRSVRTA